MPQTLDKCPPMPLCEAVDALARLLPDAVAHFAPDAPRLLRVAVPLAGAHDPMAWLRAQQGSPSRYFWGDRAGAFFMAGIGEADILEPEGQPDFGALFARMHGRLNPAQPALRYYGGFRFQEGRRKGERWRRFKAYRFVVPQVEVQAWGAGAALAVNMLVSPEADRDALVGAALARLAQVNCAAPDAEYAIPPVHDRVDLPDRDTWLQLVESALAEFEGGALEKVVLARETSFLADSNFDPVDVAARLHQQTQNTYVFCFQPAPYRAFLGASPERLYKRTSTHLLSEAVAGTRPRGESEAENAAFARELLESEKDQREHHFVVRMLAEHLAPFCRNLEHAPAPEIMPLRNCQHLHTKFEAVLKDNESDAALLQSLHPTPAVGGLPREAALAWLDAHEPFDRGIYAAPVGWVGYDGAEFSVAIRSAIVRENTLALYAGAGIVPGSKAEEEWAEINQKMKSLLGVLTEDNTA